MVKQFGIEQISLRYVVPNDIVTGEIFDVVDNPAVAVYFNYCQTNNTDHLTTPPTFHIEGRYDSLEFWTPVVSWQPDRTAPADAELTLNVSAGATALTFSSVPAFWQDGEYAFLQHVINGSPYDLSKSEFLKILKITGTNVDLVDALELTHLPATTSDSVFVYNRAQRWTAHINTTSLVSLRLLIDASPCDKEFVAEAYIGTSGVYSYVPKSFDYLGFGGVVCSGEVGVYREIASGGVESAGEAVVSYNFVATGGIECAGIAINGVI